MTEKLRLIPLDGHVTASVAVPGSKSYTNRALFIAALTPGSVRIENALISDDTESMIACLESLGIKISRSGNSINVTGDVKSVKDEAYELDAGLSGITLRFMLALCAILPGQQTLSGQPGLLKRPVASLVESLRKVGADIEYLGETGYAPLRINSSSLRAGPVEIAGTESSQYLSALLMTAPLVKDMTIHVTGTLISKPYVDMTMGIMRQFGVAAQSQDYRHFHVKGSYKAADYTVEGDISSASYFFAIAALTGSTITVQGINPDSKQGDMAFLDILQHMGAGIKRGRNSLTVRGKGVKPVRVDMQACPDQAQTLAVLAAFAKGKTVISGIKSLRVKETERVLALEQELGKMGIKTRATPDTLTIEGGGPRPASISTYGDHRMAMAFAVAGSRLEGVSIEDPRVVSKTFPGFWEAIAETGIKTEVQRPNIVLIGMRGSGKTTVAKALAKKLGIKRIDLDELMAERLTLTTPEIIEKHGWKYFRDQESELAEEVSKDSGTLISTGGGIILKPENVTRLKQNGTIILLRTSAEVLIQRLNNSKGRPPLTQAKSMEQEVRQVLRERQSLYENAADITIDTDHTTADQVVEQIMKRLES